MSVRILLAAVLIFLFLGLVGIIYGRGLHRGWTAGEIGRGLRRGAGLLLFNFIATLAVLELVLRLYASFSTNPLLLPETAATRDEAADIQARLERRKGTRLYGVPFNSMGFRDDEVVRPKPANYFRIVALADSFGVIANVPRDAFHVDILERSLRGAAGTRTVEIVNLGVSSTGPRHYLSVLQEVGSLVEPDLVIVYLFLGNDLSDPGGIERNFASRWDRLLLFRLGARAWRLAHMRIDHVTRDSDIGRETPPAYVFDWHLEPPTMPRADFLAVEMRRSRIFDPSAPLQSAETALGYIEEIQTLTQRLTARPLVVILIPDELQVNDVLRAEIESARESGHPLDPSRPNRFLAQRLLPRGVELIDLLPALERAQRELGRVYHLQNTHWNANGNRVAAREIERQLRRRPELFR